MRTEEGAAMNFTARRQLAPHWRPLHSTAATDPPDRKPTDPRGWSLADVTGSLE